MTQQRNWLKRRTELETLLKFYLKRRTIVDSGIRRVRKQLEKYQL